MLRGRNFHPEFLNFKDKVSTRSQTLISNPSVLEMKLIELGKVLRYLFTECQHSLGFRHETVYKTHILFSEVFSRSRNDEARGMTKEPAHRAGPAEDDSAEVKAGFSNLMVDVLTCTRIAI